MEKQLSPEQWEAVEKRMYQMEGAALRVDDLEVTFKVMRLKGMRLGIVPIQFRSDWLEEERLELKLFCRPVKKSIWTAKSKRAMAKMSKARLKRLDLDPKETRIQYYPWWTDFKQLKSHLLKNAKSIELLEA